MFALAVAPMLFVCALLMAHKKTMLIGYFSALLFASAGQFQNEMTYDPVGLINTSIAAVAAAACALVLWAIVAPQTSDAARRRFVRAAHRALARIVAPQPRIGLAEFETAMTEALDQLRGSLRDDNPDDVESFEAGIALLGVGRELIWIRESPYSSAAVDFELQIAKLAGPSAGGVVRSPSSNCARSSHEMPRRTARGRARAEAGAGRSPQSGRLRGDG